MIKYLGVVHILNLAADVSYICVSVCEDNRRQAYCYPHQINRSAETDSPQYKTFKRTPVSLCSLLLKTIQSLTASLSDDTMRYIDRL